MRAATGVRRTGCVAALLIGAACAHGSGTAEPRRVVAGGPQNGSAAANTESAIAAALDDFHDAAAHADEERYFAHFASDGVFLGTDATERWDVQAFRAYAHPYFARGHGWSFHGVRRRIAVRGELAWFEEDLETKNLGAARGSGVLAFHDGRWLVEQYVLSITVPNDKMAAVKELLAR
jgi:ketosteroid isomerase-like protein